MVVVGGREEEEYGARGEVRGEDGEGGKGGERGGGCGATVSGTVGGVGV